MTVIYAIEEDREELSREGRPEKCGPEAFVTEKLLVFFFPIIVLHSNVRKVKFYLSIRKGHDLHSEGLENTFFTHCCLRVGANVTEKRSYDGGESFYCWV